MIIGTAGHVDHGKTALVKALTGIDTDRLAEEKRRGITIDLGYAYAGGLGFIDVPGHERFVHTMLAGASGIDAALLVVAADDGVMPQTREHAQILDLLGIDRAVVALTKIDLVGAERMSEAERDVRTLLAGTAIEAAPILPVSAPDGRGIAPLLAALTGLGARARDTGGYPRLAVDRAFLLSGAGLVVTGTLVAGTIRVEDRLVLSPGGIALRVRGLHAQNRPAETAHAGQRVALNIAGPRLSKEAVARGDWVVHPDVHAPTADLDARIRLLAGEAKPLGADARVHVHLAAAHVTARASVLDGSRLEPGGSALVRLTLDRPIGALAGDRIVLRNAAADRTIGGGAVVDPFPPRRGRRTPVRLARLGVLETPDPVLALRALLDQPPGWIDRANFLRARNRRAQDAAAMLADAGAAALGSLAVGRPVLLAWQEDVVALLAAHHAAAADQPGLQPERLRALLSVRLPADGFRALIASAIRHGAVEQDGPWLRLPSHRATLSASDERIWRNLRPLIGQERFRPPRTRDLARALTLPEPQTRATLKRLQRMGHLIEVAHDHFFLRETVAEMAAIVAELAQEAADGDVTAATFRDRVANGRKVAIQILEFFDGAGITIRSGDERRVRLDRVDLFGPPSDARPG